MLISSVSFCGTFGTNISQAQTVDEEVLTLAPAACARVQVVRVQPVGSVHLSQQLPDVHHLRLSGGKGKGFAIPNRLDTDIGTTPEITESLAVSC